jgi:hypothetical protein
MEIDKSAQKCNRIGLSPMKGLAVFFSAVLAGLPTASGEESPSPASRAVGASHGMLSRDTVVPLSVVTRVFPVITQEISTGQNSTAAGQPTATRSVVYGNSDNSKKVTISVDRYASPGDALGAYEEAVQKSRSVPGFNPIAAPNLGPHTFMGSVTQGAETHIGLGALGGASVVGLTLAGFDLTPDTIAKLISLAREEEKACHIRTATHLPPNSSVNHVSSSATKQRQLAPPSGLLNWVSLFSTSTAARITFVPLERSASHFRSNSDGAVRKH